MGTWLFKKKKKKTLQRVFGKTQLFEKKIRNALRQKTFTRLFEKENILTNVAKQKTVDYLKNKYPCKCCLTTNDTRLFEKLIWWNLLYRKCFINFENKLSFLGKTQNTNYKIFCSKTIFCGKMCICN